MKQMKPEEIQPEVTADWAREQAENTMSQMVKVELDTVLRCIAFASGENKKCLPINW